MAGTLGADQLVARAAAAERALTGAHPAGPDLLALHEGLTPVIVALTRMRSATRDADALTP